MMRRVIWPALTIFVAWATFGIGRFGAEFHTLPDMVATLQEDEAGFSRAFDDRIRARFPRGSSEQALIDYLAGEKFAPDWRRRNAPNASALILNGLICQRVIRVNWRADVAGVLSGVNGVYDSHCM